MQRENVDRLAGSIQVQHGRIDFAVKRKEKFLRVKAFGGFTDALRCEHEHAENVALDFQVVRNHGQEIGVHDILTPAFSGASKPPLVDGLAHMDHVMNEIEVLPSKRE